MPHARDEHGFSTFDESSFVLLLEDFHNSLALSTKNFTKTDTSPHPNYQGFLHEQVIIQNIITEEDEWKAHTGDYYSASKRDKALKKNKKLLKLVHGQEEQGKYSHQKFYNSICRTP